MNAMRRSITAILAFTFLAITGSSLFAGEDDGYIYGKVIMKNDTEYQGVIRWGDEESFWDDMFNATKLENEYADYFYDDDLEVIGDDNRDRRNRKRGRWFVRWSDNSGVSTHQFKCRFGDIQSMELLGRDGVLLTFKNGEEIELEDGSNDVGTEVKVFDKELGSIDLKWRRIDRIEFMETPNQLSEKFGEPLFGQVTTRNGSFEGFIQWDHDECLSTDILDGESDDGKMKIEFGKIASIKRERRGALVTLKSGREIYLDDSNDVDEDNRGIVVKDPKGYGKALIEWREFEEIRFSKPSGSGPAYNDFKSARVLEARIETKDGQTVSGKIAYDLDESFDLEMLDGKFDRVEYHIPFRNISSITPQRRYGSLVKLRNGDTLELEESRDVDDDNAGILVWTGGENVSYVPWDNVEKVEFK